MTQPQTISHQFTISSDHPSLAGHFLGQPIVPGVILLEYLQQCLAQWKQVPVTLCCIKSVKFLLPVSMSGIPKQRLDVSFLESVDEASEEGDSQRLVVQFRCLLNSELVLHGQCIIKQDTQL